MAPIARLENGNKKKKMVRMFEGDKKQLVNRVFSADDKLIHAILNFLYYDQDTYCNYPITLTSLLCHNPKNYSKILTTLVFLLEHQDIPKLKTGLLAIESEEEVTEVFPWVKQYGRMTQLHNYPRIYQNLSLKVLFLLDKLTQANPAFFMMTYSPELGIEVEEESKDAEEEEENKPMFPMLEVITKLRKVARKQGHKQLCPLLSLIQMFSSNIIK